MASLCDIGRQIPRHRRHPTGSIRLFPDQTAHNYHFDPSVHNYHFDPSVHNYHFDPTPYDDDISPCAWDHLIVPAGQVMHSGMLGAEESRFYGLERGMVEKLLSGRRQEDSRLL